MSLMGLSSSTSMGTLVLWIHVLVHRCLSLTYEFLQGTEPFIWAARGKADVLFLPGDKGVRLLQGRGVQLKQGGDVAPMSHCNQLVLDALPVTPLVATATVHLLVGQVENQTGSDE